jgi:C-methyltransferase-like protein/putative zinc binding protein/methyltransferase family protein
MNCRMCGGGQLYQFLDLGSMPPADQFRCQDRLAQPAPAYPLQVLMCEGCGLAQLGCVVDPRVLYQDNYPYEASTTSAGRRHWAQFAEKVVRQLEVTPGSLIVDVGSNVGVLLNAFALEGMRIQGVDPALNIAAVARTHGVDTISDFFTPAVADAIVKAKGRASIVTGTNVFAHIDDLTSFVRAIDALLVEDGTLIIEAPYFANLVAYTEYDTIYHEHLSYLSVRPLVAFFERFGMEVFDVQQVEIHGGSFRVFVGRRGRHPVTSSVPQLLAQEEMRGLHSRQTLDAFAEAVEENRRDLVWLLQDIKAKGMSIAGVSAPAKGMTLLNYCQIDGKFLDFITEKSVLKIGRFTPGTRVRVVPDEELVRAQPDYALLLAWNFADEIMYNLDTYRQRGGRFIIPIPMPRIVA